MINRVSFFLSLKRYISLLLRGYLFFLGVDHALEIRLVLALALVHLELEPLLVLLLDRLVLDGQVLELLLLLLLEQLQLAQLLLPEVLLVVERLRLLVPAK